MPGLDGYGATRRIRELEKERSLLPTPIIAMTANALEGDRDLCLASGMSDYLSKPLDPEALQTIVQHATPRDSDCAVVFPYPFTALHREKLP